MNTDRQSKQIAALGCKVPNMLPPFLAGRYLMG